MPNRPARSRALLLHPPLADPTQPYLSLPTLKGHLRAKGLDATVVDLNVEATHHLISRRTLAGLIDLLRHRGHRARREEERVLTAARSGLDDLIDSLGTEEDPLAVLRDPERFYDPVAYRAATRRVEAAFAALSAANAPYGYGFNRADRGGAPWSIDGLADYSETEKSPFLRFYRELFAAAGEGIGDWDDDAATLRVPLDDVDFVGISIIFPSQVAEAFALAALMRELAPGAFLALGGPCLHQAVVHMDDDRRRRLLGRVDAIGLYEGEPTLEALLPLLPELAAAPREERERLLATVPHLLTKTAAGELVQGPRALLDLREAAPPDYGDLDLDRYLAPSRTLLYAPTRGCYWGRCSFCYYGLAETSTARYREIPPDRAAADLKRLSQRHGVKNFYISCDVLSPSYAARFAQALVDRGLKIRWSCDLKLDGTYSAERCELLHRSGLRAAAFGIESGSDRVLRAMHKGCDRATMELVNRRFHAAGIATEWMTFTGHPGETLAEALETVDWIDRERDAVDLFIIGEFGLQAGSPIAQDPAAFGVTNIRLAEGDDLGLYPLYDEVEEAITRREREELAREVDRVAADYTLRAYPWAGAVSTHHSLLWFIRHGTGVFRKRKSAAPALGPSPRR